MGAAQPPEFEVNVCWGSFDALGNWNPNPNLSLSSEEQYRQNVENGHIVIASEKPRIRKNDGLYYCHDNKRIDAGCGITPLDAWKSWLTIGLSRYDFDKP